MDLIKQLVADLSQSNSNEVKLSIIAKYYDLAKKLSDPVQKKHCFSEIAILKNKSIEELNNSKQNTIDTTIPVVQNHGSIHVLTMVIDKVRRIMHGFGFIEEFGPCIDDIEHNFTALNVSETHPSAGLHETFYLQNNQLLRSHTSNTQIRILESGRYQGEFAIFTIGKTYRKDDDPTHSPMFTQMEWMSVSPKITVGHLKFFARSFIETFFGIKNVVLRFRANCFPFTSPSMEVDILTKLDPNGHLSFCTEFISDGKWFELLGSGLIAKNILERYGYLNTNGFAIGLGIERLAMLKYGINDLRDFYANKYPFIQNASFNIQDFGEN